MSKFECFPPIVFEDSKILILGSFPSVKSRENNFYYGNPQNKFWKIIALAFEEKLPLTIKEKIELCKKHQIALWDVYAQSDIKGSSDLSLSKSEYELNDIESFLTNHKNIEKIICNGAIAYNTLKKNFSISLPIIKLTSTSPACVTFNQNDWINSLKS